MIYKSMHALYIVDEYSWDSFLDEARPKLIYQGKRCYFMVSKAVKSNHAELQALVSAKRMDAERTSEALFRVHRRAEINGIEKVPSDYLYKLITSRRFSNNVRLSLGNTEKLGVESGFLTFRQVNSQFTRMTTVEKGTAEEMHFDISSHEQILEQKFEAVFLHVASFHTHPNRDIAIPSLEDIRNATLARPAYAPEIDRGFIVYPAALEMIAISGRKGTELLAMQRNPMISGPVAVSKLVDNLEYLSYDLHGSRSGSEVVEIIEDYGYRATVVKTSQSGRIGKQDAIQMALKFAYEPMTTPGAY